jgi:hypothetical protein
MLTQHDYIIMMMARELVLTHGPWKVVLALYHWQLPQSLHVLRRHLRGKSQII